MFEAKDNNAETVILVDHKDNITEGPGFNVFAVIKGIVVTPDRGVLEGISRRTILDICEELSIPTEIRSLSQTEFMEADEIFLTTSSGGVVPITRVNDRIFSNNTPGEMSTKLKDCYWVWSQKEELRTEIEYKVSKKRSRVTVTSSITKTFNKLIWIAFFIAIFVVLYVIYIDYPELIGL